MKTFRLAFSGLVLIASLAFPTTTPAHSAPEKARAFYGGVIQETPRYNLELVVDDGRLSLFVRDRHNWPVYLPDGKAIAQLSGDQIALELTLLPSKKDALTAAGDFNKAQLQRVAVTFSIFGGEPVRAVFELQHADS